MKLFKPYLLMAGVCAGLLVVGCATPAASHSGKIAQPKVVEAACGQCQLGLKEKKGCDLAVRIHGKSYFVDGFSLRQFGNPDAAGGMCEVIRHAKVTGKIEDGRFTAARFELLPAENKK